MDSKAAIEKMAREMAAKAQHDYAELYVTQLREHASRFRGVDGEKALIEFAKIIENADKAHP